MQAAAYSDPDATILAKVASDAEALSDSAFAAKYRTTKEEFRARGVSALGNASAYLEDGFVVSDDKEDAQERGTSLTNVCATNIVTGKRKRRAPRTIWDDPDFQEQIASAYLADVPDEEMAAALASDVPDAAISSGDEDEDADADADEEDDGAGRPAAAAAAAVAAASASDDEDYEIDTDDMEITDDEDEDEAAPSDDEV